MGHENVSWTTDDCQSVVIHSRGISMPMIEVYQGSSQRMCLFLQSSSFSAST
uniref:Uncharacterized protein n=1 Tax=Peronospora matthiolae TaxID=2874970 RepID=A0AAV1V217_9STRA